ncbi:MAG: ubiquinol-cytochrome c reductase iron-sulfur subunit [Verrucomicrobiia bacterium]
MNENQKISRRTFLDWLLTGGLIAWAIAFAAPVLSYVWPAQRRGPGVQTVSAGKAADFAEWQTKIVAVNGHPVIVIRTPQGFGAFSAICTHLGCIVGWDAQRRQIACPCHAGFFDTNGRPVSGPPPRPLAKQGVMVVNGEVMVKSA